ncbi:MAG: type I DNA topoisomerase [Deltaproteobacteria bacterium]|jgi:DNA topoisomerase-1|nr:type I DNA topoisomerase [Deltaproteobacteria bacterium]
MAKDLLIVESPAKAKTISKYLGPDYQVMASIGHIRDLPKNKLGVDVENNFTPEYVPSEGKDKVIQELRRAAKGKNTVYLGPDPDREGEAIAWHIAESLGRNDHNFKRVLFHELTPQAIKAALAAPVTLSQSRFESQQTRRILDRLVGYMISPVLWEKLKRGLSAGRVQSVALRLIVERERLINAFIPEEYWTVTAEFIHEELPFEALLTKFEGEQISVKDQQSADTVVKAVTGHDFKVTSLTSKDRQRKPMAPFTTSTLQQNAYNRFKLDPSRTMRLAQDLYEGMDIPGGSVGLITYMRTDSVRVSEQAAAEARKLVSGTLGDKFLPDKPNFYKNKKGAQDAHEAVRPTSVDRTPQMLKGHLDNQHWQLYDLIWRRFVASQMAPSISKQTAAELFCQDYIFRATGSVIIFKGFLEIYDPGSDDEKNLLPPLAENQIHQAQKITPKQHFTQPPARFNEGTLVKELEDKGIGRPSTYASIISVLRDKEYVHGQKGQLRPTEMGLTVNDLLTKNFPDIIDVDFTAGLEEDLDQIEEGEAEDLAILRKLYTPLARSIEQAKDNMRNVKRDGLPVELPCPACGQTGNVSIRYGRNGFYLSCEACKHTTDFTRDDHGVPQPAAAVVLESDVLCEKCGQPMLPKRGRYGVFLACSGYPDCRNTKPLKTTDDGVATVVADEVPPMPEGFDPNCPKCGKPMTVKKARKGNWFIACTGYPKCKNAVSYPTGLKCPRPGCDGSIVEKSSSRGPFFGCSAYPGCRLILKGVPVKEPCPVCGHPYMVNSQRRGSEGQLTCPNPACSTNPSAKSAVDAPKTSGRAGRTSYRETNEKTPLAKTGAKARPASAADHSAAKKALPKTTRTTAANTAAGKKTTSAAARTKAQTAKAAGQTDQKV